MMDGSLSARPAQDGNPPKRRRPIAEIGALIEAGFQRANAKAIQAAHAAGLSVPFLPEPEGDSPTEAVVWLHPDGTVRSES